MRFKLVSRVEEIGIDVEALGQEDLEELANFIAQTVSEALSSILGSRVLGYVNTIGIEVLEGAITITIDLEVDSYLTPHISLENVLDKVLDYAFTKTKVYLSSRYRKDERANHKQ